MGDSKTFGIPEAKGLKRGSKVKFSFVLHSFSNRYRVLIKVDKYHEVCNLTLKWCKMPFYLILFQCEI